MPIPLHTDRLILRPFEERDIEAFSRYRSDPEVARWQGWQPPVTLEQAASFVAEMKTVRPGTPGQWLQLALEEKASGATIGDFAFYIVAEDHTQAEMGVTLARAWQGKGYALEAGRCLLAYLFDELGLRRVRANCDVENTASAHLLARLGFRHEGRFVESLWFKGAWSSEDWYAILRREWEAQQNG